MSTMRNHGLKGYTTFFSSLNNFSKYIGILIIKKNHMQNSFYMVYMYIF